MLLLRERISVSPAELAALVMALLCSVPLPVVLFSHLYSVGSEELCYICRHHEKWIYFLLFWGQSLLEHCFTVCVCVCVCVCVLGRVYVCSVPT